MTLNSLRSLSFLLFLGLIGSVPTFAQISDGLYKTLPDSLKPKNKSALTVRETQRILKASVDFNSDVYAKEFTEMAVFLSKKAGQITHTGDKINALRTLADYYGAMYENKRAITYYRQAIASIGNSQAYNNTLANLYSGMAQSYYAIDLSNDSTIAYLHKSMQVEGVGIDSALMTANYNAYSLIYSRLKLCAKAIYYGDLAIKSAPKFDPVLYMQQSVSYIQYYKQTQKTVYADSANLFLHQLIRATKNKAALYYEPCYYLLGNLFYKMGDYKKSKQMLDSASRPEYNKAAYFYPNNFYGVNFYKALCLIKLGHYPEGKKILDTLDIKRMEYRATKYEALYVHAQETNDWKGAFAYYKLYKSATDSLGLENQKGTMFEAEQKYNVSQKELTIAKLENQNLVKEKEKRNLLAGGILGILALGTLGYAANRRQQARVQKERTLLTDNLHRIEEEMNLKIVQQQAESEMVIANQRQDISRDMHDEVSSSLVTLQYYITDLKNEETDGRMRAVLDNIEQETRQVYAQTRRFMHRLHNSAVRTQYNVLDFLYHLTLGFSKGSSLKIYTDVDEEAVLRYFTPRHHNELYAVIKELVANSLKHSGANRLDIKLWADQDLFQFSVQDNGRGMGSTNDKGLGLDSVAKRIADLGGTIHYDSQPTGTTVAGSFPVIDLYADNQSNVVG